jgi:hypothetical protein
MRKNNIIFYISFLLIFNFSIINLSLGNEIQLPYKTYTYKNYNFPEKIEINFLPGEYKSYQTNILKMFQKSKEILDQNLKRKKYLGNISWSENNEKFTSQAKFKITGDLFDHVKYNRYFHSSLEIKVLDKNIGGMQNFKLFLIPARNGVDEVFVSLFFEMIGIISPYSKIINVNFNGKKIKMLAQEIVTSKEIQNRYKLRESVFIKADDIKYYQTIRDRAVFIICCDPKPVYDLFEDSITKKLVQNAKKNYTSILGPPRLGGDNLKSLSHPYDNTFIFFLNLFGAKHAKAITNRIFYYDPIYNYLYPIYYDGNPDLRFNNFQNNEINKKNIDDDILEILQKDNFYENFNLEFKSRTEKIEFDIEHYQEFLKKLISHISGIKIKDNSNSNNSSFFHDGFSEIDYSQNKLEILSQEIKIIDLNKLYNKNQNAKLEINFLIDKNYSGKIILKGNYNGNLTILANTKILNNYDKFITRNKFLLTGCVTIIDSQIKNLNFFSDKSLCEDSINIIRSKITNVTFEIKNSYLDGIDFDGSSATIKNAKIINSGDDCIDLSNGDYTIIKSELYNCNDKGISVGEETKLKIINSNISKAEMGIAFKDGSVSNIIEDINISSSRTCYEKYIKKNYFNYPKLLNENRILCQ